MGRGPEGDFGVVFSPLRWERMRAEAGAQRNAPCGGLTLREPVASDFKTEGARRAGEGWPKGEGWGEVLGCVFLGR